MKPGKIVLNLIIMYFLLSGCAVQRTKGYHDDFANGRYDSKFPSTSISESLDMISESVKKLDCLAFYATYAFNPEDRIQRNMISDEIISKHSISKTISNESVSGTATIVYHSNNLVGLITCAHVIEFPDSLFTWSTKYPDALATVSVIVKQQTYVTGLPDGGPVEIVAMDKVKDIALLSQKLTSTTSQVQVLHYPIGNTSLFEWGSVVYIVGYPIGNLMVTKALVSNPKKNSKGYFLTDALYNHGISGSPVFAIKDRVPNMEWVGMASSTASTDLVIVKPATEQDNLQNGIQPYNGDVYLEKVKLINYGVTYSIPIEEIVIFIRRNRAAIEKVGFDFDTYFQ
ncbi:MAG: hypothetical protein COW63_02545 [Bacteroidetes bacterium CG18_big_fil_WC_8_21_14_2_50_41_14]|nr:MAG: hypothetical protein COW63_02545 [Bacteroidetes bacterium CG18_big_fil_WC_8_21_14_2_50_41_14]PJB58890.1 MAG: hypothetical protein CO098_06280 [Bacteroidetes bacterium CG_4_9_14_3_um_filter_41_19]